MDELTAIQADAIRATAAAHDRNPKELALELMHLLIAQKTPEAINAPHVTPALTADHDDTVRILLPLEDSSEPFPVADGWLVRGDTPRAVR